MFACLTLTFVASSFPGQIVAQKDPLRITALYGLSGSSLVYVIIHILCSRRLTQSVVTASLVVLTGCALYIDLQSRVMGGVRWPLLLIVVDMFHIMELPTGHSFCLVGVSVTWLVVMGLEEGYRFGVFDLPGLAPQKGAFSRESHFSEITSCEDLPCAVGFPPSTFWVGVSVLIVNFLTTRSFARDTLKEQASMERTINAVQKIATLLAGYDVEQVAGLLETHEHELPEGMTVALRRLEENLRLYKAYLPKTCLPFDQASPGSEEEASSRSDGSSVCSLGDHVVRSSGALKSAPLGLSEVQATLVVLNVKNTLSMLGERPARFSQLFTTILQCTLTAVMAVGGMVDVFIGDRIHCSFNASRRCANHATSALHAATSLLSDCSGSFNIGTATGRLLRGDMGCDVMRRFSMVGTLVRDVHLIERAGRVFGCDVLCNRLCFSDAECEHKVLLLPCRVEMAVGEAQVVAALVSQEDTSSGVGEWMYVIGGAKSWDAYNTAVRGYLKGAVSVASVAEIVKCDGLHVVSNALAALGGQWGATLHLPVRSE